MGLLLSLGTLGLGCGAEPERDLGFGGIPKSAFKDAKWQYTRSYDESAPPALRRPLSAMGRVIVQEKLLIVALETEGQDSGSSEHPAAAWRIAGHGPLASCPDGSDSTSAAPPNPNECPAWYERPKFTPDFSTNLAPLDLADPRAAVPHSDGFDGVGRLDIDLGAIEVIEVRLFRGADGQPDDGLEVEVHHTLVRIE